MRRLIPRASKVAREVEGNVVWLAYPGRIRRRLSTDPIASLKRSVAHLALEIERSERLKADITAAVSTTRYELFRNSTISGMPASERGLVDAQRMHLNDLLKFVHVIAAARSLDRVAAKNQGACVDPLTKNLRELKSTMRRAQQLTRDMLAQTQRRNWSGIGSVPRNL